MGKNRNAIIGLVVVLLVVFIGYKTLSGSSKNEQPRKSISHTASKTSTVVDSGDPYTSNEKYNDAEGKNNERKITSDALDTNEYVGKSVHFSKAVVTVVNKDKASIWIRGEKDQSTNLGQINLQSKYYTTLLKVGDIVSVDGIYLGKQNDLLMSDDKYPTLDIININKIK